MTILVPNFSGALKNGCIHRKVHETQKKPHDDIARYFETFDRC